jgi:benzoate-CoA ligase
MTMPAETALAAVPPYNATVELLNHNLAAGRAEKLAFVDDDGAYTYREVAERVDRCANALREFGLQPSDRVVLGLLDSIAFPTAFLGAIKAGIVPIPVNTMFRAADFAYILENSGATAAIVSHAVYPAYEEAARSIAWRGRFIIANGREPSRPTFDDLVAAADATAQTAPTSADATCFWLYSSGSTGKPKGTLHRHASLMHTAAAFGQGVLGLREDDVVYSAAKLFFAYGLGNALTFPLSVGATSVLFAGRALPEAVVDILARRGATVFCGVPTLFSSMLASEAFAQRGALALRLCTSAGESLPQHVGEAWRSQTGVDIVDGIGSTEMLHIFVSTRPGDVRYGVTGYPVPGYRARIVDESGNEAARGEMGELLVSGPSAFSLYWDAPEKTRGAFSGEWVRTGDKFLQNEDGAFVHCGRVDDMIKAGGIWVSPSEVESVLIGHEAVLEAAVIGVPDANDLVKPKAFVVLRAGYAPSAALRDDLQAFVKGRLAPYKYPRWLEFVEDLPKTATGKIRRHVLRDREAELRAAAK